MLGCEKGSAFDGDDCFNDSGGDVWRRCRTPSPDYSYRHWGNPIEAKIPCATSKFDRAPPHLVMAYLPLTHAGFLHEPQKCPSLNSLVTPPTSGTPSRSETLIHSEDSDNEATGTTVEAFPASGFATILQILHPEGSLQLAHSEKETSPLGDMALRFDCSVSVGTFGHPHSCGLSCKYFWKNGCKDGDSCTRCHRCPWHSSKRKRRGRKSSDTHNVN